MDEPATICSTRIRKTFTQYKRWREGKLKAESFRGLVQVNHLLPQQLIQMLALQCYLPQNRRLQRYVDQKVVQTPNVQVNLLFFPCKNPVASDLLLGLSMSIFKFGLPWLSFGAFQTKIKTELLWVISVLSSKRNIKSN